MLKNLSKLISILNRIERQKFLFIISLTFFISALELISLQLLLDLVKIISGDSVSQAYLVFEDVWTNSFYKLDHITFIWFMFAMTLLTFFLRLGIFVALTRFAQGLRATISSRLLNTSLVDGIASNDNSNNSEKVGVIISETDQLIAYVVQPLANLSGQLSILLAIIIFMFINLGANIILFCGLLPLIYMIIAAFSKSKIEKIGTNRQKASLDRYLFSKLAIDLVLELTTSGKVNVIVGKFLTSSQNLAKDIGDAIIIANFPKYILEFFVFSTVIALSYSIDVGFIDTSETNLSSLTGVMMLASVRLLPSLQVIYQSVSQFRFGNAALCKIHNILLESKNAQFTELKNLSSGHFDSRFTLNVQNFNVCFGERAILNNLNYTFKSGKSYHLRGSSGSGKSTFLKCIAGVGPAYTGLVSCTDSNDVGKLLGAKSYIVPQKSFLGSGKLRDILTLYCCHCSDDEIIRALTFCHADKFLKQAGVTLDTVLKDAEHVFSGGQCQRLALARALIHNPDILLMDEGLSGVEVSVETQILSGLHAARPNMLFIFASHREPEIKLVNIDLGPKGDMK